MSGILTLIGGQMQADAVKSAAEENRKQLEYKAGQETAVGQHQAEAARKRATLMMSRAQAVAASSGAGPLDETLAAGILGEGEKAAGFAGYESKERAKGLQYQGEVGVRQAKRQADAIMMTTFASVASQAEGGMSKLSPGKPPAHSERGGSF